METIVDTLPIKSVVIRNERGQIQAGSAGINLVGRPKLGLTVAESYRKFLSSKQNKSDRKSRIDKQMEVLYEISIDKAHKQCVQAAIYCQARAYGEIPKEVNVKIAALQAIQILPDEHKTFFAEMFADGDDSLLLPEGEENEDNDEIETLADAVESQGGNKT
jgi:hypothetical protein